MPRPLLPNTEAKLCYYCAKEKGIGSPYSRDGEKAAEAYGLRPIAIGAGHHWMFNQYGRDVQYVSCLAHYHSTEAARDAKIAEKAARKASGPRAPRASVDVAALIAQGVAQALQALGVAVPAPAAPAAPTAPAVPAPTVPAPAAQTAPSAPAAPGPRDFEAELAALRAALQSGEISFADFASRGAAIEAEKAAAAPAPRRPEKGGRK